MKKILGLGFVAIATLFVHACGSDSTTVALSTKHTATYTGAGSVWSWALTEAGAFTAIKKATSASTTEEMHIEGTYETYATGFYKFTVVTATGGPSAGDTAFGFAVPSVILIVKPTGDNSETLVMPVLSGVCPTFPATFNWVQASVQGATNTHTRQLWGNASIPSATGTLTGQNWTLDGASAAMGSPPTFTGCTDGRLTFSDGYVAMTSGGVGIVNQETGNGDIIAFPRDTTVTEATLRNKNYVGLVFIDNSTNPRTQPVNFTLPASGDGTYTFLTDVTTGASSDTGPIGISSIGTGEQAGFAKLVANASGASIDPDPPTMWAAVSTISGHTVFFASGFNRNSDGSADAGDNFSLIAVEK